MSRPGGADDSASSLRPAVLDPAIEIAALLAALPAFALVMLRGRSLADATAAWRPLLPLALAILLGLLALRSRRARVGPPVRAGLAPGHWLAGLEAPGLLLATVFVGLLLALPPASETLGADGGVYLEQLRAVVLGGRLFTHPGAEPGMVVLLAPFYLLGHGVAVGAKALGIDVAASGDSEPYLNALRLGAATYGLLAALFAQRAAARFVTPLLASVCAAGFWLGSTLYHYTLAEPVMPHAPGAAASSLLLLLWLRARESPGRSGRWMAVAFVGGLLVTIQRYDAYLLLPALLSAVMLAWRHLRRRNPAGRRPAALTAAAACAAFGLAVLPLVLLTLATPDRFLLNPEIIRTQMLADWARPHVAPLLFSSNGGFFAWTPLAVPAVVGLVLLARRSPGVGLPLLTTLALGVYVLASTPTWSAGFSFGARRLTEAYPLLVLGLCVTAQALLRRPAVLGFFALALFVLQNVLFSEQVQRGRVLPGDSASFLTAVSGAAEDFHRALGHPGSWPANWAFAWEHGVSPGRFDDLYGRRPRNAWSLRIGSPEDAAVVGRGWSRAEEGGAGRWAEGEDATLLLTLTPPVDRRLRLRGASARSPDARTQSVSVEVNGRRTGSLSLTPEGRTWEVLVPAAAWRSGLNEIRFRPAWRLSRKEAWAVDELPYAAWKLEEIAVGP
jgi:hypothetical protein